MNFLQVVFSADTCVFSGMVFSSPALVGFFFALTFMYPQTESSNVKGVKNMVVSRIVNADKEKTWKLISDVSNYHKIAPNIDSVEIISGKDKGMIRKCTHKGDSWTEVATLWEEGERYSFKVDTDADDYPYPLKFLQGTWIITKISARQTEISMQFDFTYKRKIHNLLIHPFVKSKFKRTSEELLDNWQRKLETE